VNDRGEERYMNAMLALVRGDCTPDSIARLSAARDISASLHPSIHRAILVNLQDDERCMALKARLGE